MKKKFLWVWVYIFILMSFSLASGAPKDTIIIAQGVDPTTLDPQNYFETPAFNVCLNIYETLLLRDDQMKLQPLLAAYYKLINDHTWEFSLRRGVKFQNGEDFKASAVKFSLERIADPKNKMKQTTLQ